MGKAEPRLDYGIFLGYRVAPGGRWNGEYLVCSLDNFIGACLRWDAESTAFNLSVHITKKVVFDHKELRFPLQERYNWWNYTIQGREKAKKVDLMDIIGESEDLPLPDSMPDGLPPPLIRPELDADGKLLPLSKPSLPPGYYGVYVDTGQGIQIGRMGQ